MEHDANAGISSTEASKKTDQRVRIVIAQAAAVAFSDVALSLFSVLFWTFSQHCLQSTLPAMAMMR